MMKLVTLLLLAASTCSAFVAPSSRSSASFVRLNAMQEDSSAASFDPLGMASISSRKMSSTGARSVTGAMAAAMAAMVASPLMALAEEAEGDYEYGAVDAPIGLAWAGGVVLILTALLPIAMQGGEEAFDEMKERDSTNWGKKDQDTLKKRK
eukprot:CAMPEP_0198290950 /NCGR_PEP_ID=MMETSP1449-20131203/8631_1 /TAXON_ID=420275 /ORGANISM="Attheya septentrionalis, Strain CCMP2084" /LENGTH=151 /DNA_ID=CAMNT_0043989519 /DNA_START=61 /DNA_END=516 /DNA_ORIENTATION=+